MTRSGDFDVTEPITAAVTAIQASAGTGKTYALSGLTVRLLADGDATTDRVLLVTFTRAATAELRARIRARIVEVLDDLVGDDPATDDLIAYLRVDDPSRHRDRDTRIGNLYAALSRFDELVVTTIHGFAQQALATFGVDAGVATDAEVEPADPRELADACRDEWAITVLHADDEPALDDLLGGGDPEADPTGLIDTDGTLSLAHALAADPALRVHPDVDDTGDPRNPTELMVTVARRAVDRAREDRARRNVRSYDDLILDLRDAIVRLSGTDRAARLDAVRERFRFVLIDEFQDTDPIQWEIFSSLFDDPAHPGTRLVLVGDPKQAIYRFRGADLDAYATAVRSAGRTRSLGTNWRSDPVVLAALEKLFGGVGFGAGAAFEPDGVRPGAASDGLRLSGEPVAGMSIRVVHNDDDTDHPVVRGATPKARPHYQVGSVRAAIREDLVGRIGALLDAGTIGPDPVDPGDIAVLVDTRAEAAEVADRLRVANIPAAVRGTESVLDSPAADEWRLLLSAVANPSNPRRMRAAALGIFGGARDVDDLVDHHGDPPTDDDRVFSIQAFHERIAAWAGTLARAGIATFVSTVFEEAGVAGRGREASDGGRLLTDLEHVGDLLREFGSNDPGTLLDMLDDPRMRGDSPDAPDVRRVDSDRRTVTVMTMHTSKGLEFPIVCCPALHTPRVVRNRKQPAKYHDDDGRLVYDLDVTGGGVVPDAAERADREDLEDRLRLAYVALTRAIHHVIVWSAWTTNAKHGPITRLIHGRDPSTGAPDDTMTGAPKDFNARLTACSDDEFIRAAERLEQRPASIDTGPTITVGTHDATPCTYRWIPPTDTADTIDPDTLELFRLGRSFPHVTARWSFTAMARHRDHDHRAAVEDPRRGEDEPDDAESANPAADLEQGTPPGPRASGLVGLTRGAAFGTLVHEILERADFTAPDPAGELERIIADELSSRPTTIAWIDTAAPPAPSTTRTAPANLLRDGLVRMIDTPLGTIAGDIALREVPRSDRLDELAFDLRLPNATRPVRVAEIGSVLAAHLADDDPYRAWAESLAERDLDLAGHLTGSIDLVLRVGDGSDRRFVVIDYKTNAVHPADGDVGDAYARVSLADAMVGADYPLQALLYSVALHRYLRWRLAGYDPERHLGGAAYLFVRGMTGADPDRSDADHPAGVARWDLPPAAVVAVSDVLAGPRTEATR